MPLIMTKDPNDKPYIDWKRKYYIDDIFTEDDCAGIWERAFMKSRRVGRKTTDAQLRKMFPERLFVKQVDIPGTAKQSSDLIVSCHRLDFSMDKRMYVRGPHTKSNLCVSEHAVKQYWRREGKPNVFDWFNIPYESNDQAVAVPEGLFLGQTELWSNLNECLVLDTQQIVALPGKVYRLNTFVNNDLLRPEQVTLQQQLLQEYTRRQV